MNTVSFHEDEYGRVLKIKKDGFYYSSIYSKSFKIDIKRNQNNIYLINKQGVVFCAYNKISGFISTGGKLPPIYEDINWEDTCNIINFKKMLKELKK